MSTILFDARMVKPSSSFGFGVDPADWDRAAEDALMLDMVSGVSVPNDSADEDDMLWAAHYAAEAEYELLRRMEAEGEL